MFVGASAALKDQFHGVMPRPGLDARLRGHDEVVRRGQRVVESRA
jgi:hypothetical protein